MFRRSFLFAAAVILASLPVDLLSAQAPASGSAALPMVILVRHAEKDSTPADDPPLTALGMQRAKALDQALMGAGVTAIITTEYRRTRETVAPLAARRGIAPEIVNVKGMTVEAHAQAVAAAIRKHSGVVLVVGHSNTVPAIIAALGGERMRDICDADYSNLFIVSRSGSALSLVRSRYGTPDKSESTPALCAAMRGGR